MNFFLVNVGIVQLPSRVDDHIDIDGYMSRTSGFGRFDDNSQYTAANLLYVDAPILGNTAVSCVIKIFCVIFLIKTFF